MAARTFQETSEKYIVFYVMLNLYCFVVRIYRPLIYSALKYTLPDECSWEGRGEYSSEE